MIAHFAYRGVEYQVRGWNWSSDGAGNGIIVRRIDGRKIRGTIMHPGMVQTGVSRSLASAAVKALELEREADDEA